MKVAVILIVIDALNTVTKKTAIGTGGLGNERTRGEYPNYGIIMIGQNTEKESWRLEERLLSLKLQWKTICKCWREKLSNK